MAWKKILETNEVVSFEKKNKKVTVRIEARYLENNEWIIFKRYYNQNDVNLTEEFYAHNKDELKQKLSELKEGKTPSVNELKIRAREMSKELNFQVERIYKNSDVEKWRLKHKKYPDGYVTLFYGDNMIVDIVIDKKMKYLEDKITHYVEKTFNLNNSEELINYNIVYFEDVNSFSISYDDLTELMDDFNDE